MLSAFMLVNFNVDALAGPFGFEKGMVTSELDMEASQPTKKAFEYRFEKAPNSTPLVDYYLVTIPPKTGLCQIEAFREVPTNVHGSQLVEQYEEMKARLSKRYGKAKQEEYLLPGSLWSEPQDFTSSLMFGERLHRAFWRETSQAKLNELSEISVRLTAKLGVLNPVGFLVVSYQFDNIEECKEEIELEVDVF
ncbi:MAG: hypothetical protein ACJ0RG_08135 [Candidatus Azotimanducaceae bacterium]